jgi:hypothetical protein
MNNIKHFNAQPPAMDRLRDISAKTLFIMGYSEELSRHITPFVKE